MDKAKAAVIKRYEKALQFYLTYIPSDDAGWDQRIWTELKNADIEVREHELEGKPEYNEAVLRADRIAHDIRARRS